MDGRDEKRREKEIRENFLIAHATWVSEHHEQVASWHEQVAPRVRTRASKKKSRRRQEKSETEGGEESTRLWPSVCVFWCRFFTNGASMIGVHGAAFGIFSDGDVSWNDPRYDEGSIVPTELIEEKVVRGFCMTCSTVRARVGFALAAGFAWPTKSDTQPCDASKSHLTVLFHTFASPHLFYHTDT